MNGFNVFAKKLRCLDTIPCSFRGGVGTTGKYLMTFEVFYDHKKSRINLKFRDVCQYLKERVSNKLVHPFTTFNWREAASAMIPGRGGRSHSWRSAKRASHSTSCATNNSASRLKAPVASPAIRRP